MGKNVTPTPNAVRALVLQGGGALGAYELGAARRLYAGRYRPDFIAGVSIGAITAVLLARPGRNDPLRALEAFWQRVAVPGAFLLPALRAYASLFGNPAFFAPRHDFLGWAHWTSLYDLAPLRATLSDLVDVAALANPRAEPRLIVTATEIKSGEIKVFDSAQDVLSLDHIVASASLPPSFPPTPIGDASYWDGGLFDNTPLGAVLDRLDPSPEKEAEREVIVVNLFPNASPVPTNMAEVGQRVLNLLFSNKTHSDVKLLRRFDDVAALVDAIAQDPRCGALTETDAFKAVAEKRYIKVPNIIEITRSSPAESDSGMDFSPEGIAARAAEGFKDTAAKLAGR